MKLSASTLPTDPLLATLGAAAPVSAAPTDAVATPEFAQLLAPASPESASPMPGTVPSSPSSPGLAGFVSLMAGTPLAMGEFAVAAHDSVAELGTESDCVTVALGPREGEPVPAGTGGVLTSGQPATAVAALSSGGGRLMAASALASRTLRPSATHAAETVSPEAEGKAAGLQPDGGGTAAPVTELPDDETVSVAAVETSTLSTPLSLAVHDLTDSSPLLLVPSVVEEPIARGTNCSQPEETDVPAATGPTGGVPEVPVAAAQGLLRQGSNPVGARQAPSLNSQRTTPSRDDRVSAPLAPAGLPAAEEHASSEVGAQLGVVATAPVETADDVLRLAGPAGAAPKGEAWPTRPSPVTADRAAAAEEPVLRAGAPLPKGVPIRAEVSAIETEAATGSTAESMRPELQAHETGAVAAIGIDQNGRVRGVPVGRAYPRVSVAEKIAAHHGAMREQGEFSVGAAMKERETAAAKGFAGEYPVLGTTVANEQGHMPALVHSSRLAPETDIAPAAGGLAEVGAADTGTGRDGESFEWAATGARRAVEAALNAADQLARGEHRTVSLKFTVGDTELAVHVERREDELRATFRTDSAELRAALVQECRAIPEGTDRSFRVATHVTSTLPAGSGASSESFSDANRGRQGLQDAEASPGLPGLPGLRRRGVAASASAALGEATIRAVPSATSRHLSTVA
ncbi:MAG: hypothetical protein HZC55_01980 [Verrucomicrobia bacterium]|nr:hypothetical protein [Verrucomicrobiota bacterium]